MLIGQTWVTRPPGPGGRRGPHSSREPRVGGGVSIYQQLQGSAATTAHEPCLALGLFLSYPQAKNNFYILKDFKKRGWATEICVAYKTYNIPVWLFTGKVS